MNNFLEENNVLMLEESEILLFIPIRFPMFHILHCYNRVCMYL